MPGFNLIVYARQCSDQARIPPTLELQAIPRSYRTESVFEGEHCLLTCTFQPHYPRQAWEHERFNLYLEGHLYGRSESDVKRTAITLAERAADRDHPYLTERLLDLDGDFVLVARDKISGDWLVLNDLFGRLPVYFGNLDDGILVSRNIALPVALCGHKVLDALGSAQFLLFGHPLGERTLWERISVLAPATLLRIRQDGATEMTGLHRFDFTAPQQAGDVNKHAMHLADLFQNACIGRAQLPGEHLLALSGGLDSRAVAAGLADAGDPLHCATMSRPDRYPGDEVSIAQAVALRLALPWQEVALPPSRGEDYLELFKIKQGLNELGMAFHMAFFHRIRDQYGEQMVYFTGDGGDKALPDLCPQLHLRDAEAACFFTIHRRGVFTLSESAVLTGLPERSLREALLNQFVGYPERDGNGCYTHFLIQERGRRWLYEGEDRNRHYFWSSSPFYSPTFFRAAMACPQHLKRSYLLYRAFLARLQPDLAELRTAGMPGAIGSATFALRYRLVTLAKSRPRLARHLQRLLRTARGFPATEPALQLLGEQLGVLSQIDSGLDIAACRRVLATAETRPKRQILLLLTLSTMLESLHGGDSLQRWRDRTLP